MSDISSLFEQASQAAKSLPQRPDNDTMLKLYALYKQGSVGDVSGDKPGMFDFVGAAKYDAWERVKGVSQASAQQQYIDLVKSLGGEVDD